MRQVEALLSGVRVTHARVLALFALRMLWAGTVRRNQVAAALPLGVRVLSTERRLGRFLANAAVSVETLWPTLLPSLLAPWAGQEVTLVFDPTPLWRTWTLLWIGLAQHRRVLPLAWRLVPQQTAWSDTVGPLRDPLLAQIAAALPAGCTVTLLADRGVSGPTVRDLCQVRGWEVVLRLNVGETQAHRLRVAVPDAATDAPRWGEECRLWDVVGVVRSGWTAWVQIFKGAGWRSGELTVYQRRGMQERGVLFSTRSGGYARGREYARRGHVDATCADSKRRGWGLAESCAAGGAPGPAPAGLASGVVVGACVGPDRHQARVACPVRSRRSSRLQRRALGAAVAARPAVARSVSSLTLSPHAHWLGLPERPLTANYPGDKGWG
jgi:hypothetical protein